MDIKECEEKQYIKKTRINKELAKSLIEASSQNEETAKTLININTPTAPIFNIAYDSLRQILEAYCIIKGYKVTNHICLGELIKKLNPDFDFNLFDRARWIRNSIQYYGEEIEEKQGKEIIWKILTLKNQMLQLLEEEIKK